MRTITKKINLYPFSELSEKAKEEAYANYLKTGDCWACESEARATMEEVEKLFHIKLKNWSINTYRPEYPDINFDTNWWTDYDYNGNYFDRTELKGNRARAFLWNNFGHVLTRGRFYSNRYGKKYDHSRIFFDRVYKGTCPLTGVYFDCEALDPLACFCFGVKWSDEKKGRVMTKERTIAHDNRTTVENVIRDCIHAMFKSFLTDLEESESIEHFADECKANDWEFTEDGVMF